MTLPFEYPSAPHVHRHGPHGYTDYARFLPWLRDEFSFRCVYCLTRERWGLVLGSFHMDHFLAVAHQPGLLLDYDNLRYACVSCNLAKGHRKIPDPLIELTSAKVQVASDGTIHSDYPSAARLIELLGLDGSDYVRFRKLIIDTVELAQQKPDVYQQWMRYPDKLPHLRRRKPPHNVRPTGVEQSAYARRERGELPPTY